MDILKHKYYNQYDYMSRQAKVPNYYNTFDDREQAGIGYNMLKDTDWVAHKVQPTDTLDKLALSYYNNPSYWWAIAYFNDIQDPFIRLSDYFEIIKVPAMNSLVFGDLR